MIIQIELISELGMRLKSVCNERQETVSAFVAVAIQERLRTLNAIPEQRARVKAATTPSNDAPRVLGDRPFPDEIKPEPDRGADI